MEESFWNIKEYFIPNFDSRDVLCFIPYSDGYLVSTLNNGVYYITENSAELKFSFNGVIKIFVSPNHNIICISKFEKPAVVIYDFASGEKITTSNKLRVKDKQYPKDALMLDNGDFCVLGKPSGGNPSDSLLHYWKLDEGQIGYNYVDVGANKASIFYEVKFLNESADHIYISGVNQNRLFVWVYDKLDIKKEPEEIKVNELCSLSNINRSTFYDRYGYLDALVNEIIEEEINKISIDEERIIVFPVDFEQVNKKDIERYIDRFYNNKILMRFCSVDNKEFYISKIISKQIETSLPFLTNISYYEALFQCVGALTILIEFLNDKKSHQIDDVIDIIYKHALAMFKD